VPDLTVTVLCSQHRVRVKPGTRPGTVEHLGGNVDPYCQSQRFMLRWEQQADRETALAAMRKDEERGRNPL
jgi:hypothetical protein